MAVRGTLAEVSINTTGTTYAKIGGRLDGSFSISTATIDATNADSGGWDEFIEGNSSATLQFSCHYLSADAGQTALIAAKFDAATTATKFKWCTEKGTGKDEYTADCIITSLEQSAEDASRLSCTLQVTGKPTKAAQS